MHHIRRRQLGCKGAGSPFKYEFSIGEASVEAKDLYDAARRFRGMGFSGPALSYAQNGTLSMTGTLERWSELVVRERDRGGITVEKYQESPFAKGDGE